MNKGNGKFSAAAGLQQSTIPKKTYVTKILGLVAKQRTHQSGGTAVAAPEVRGDLGGMFSKGSEMRVEDKQREKEKHSMGEVDCRENGEDAKKWSDEYTTLISWN